MIVRHERWVGRRPNNPKVVELMASGRRCSGDPSKHGIHWPCSISEGVPGTAHALATLDYFEVQVTDSECLGRRLGVSSTLGPWTKKLDQSGEVE